MHFAHDSNHAQSQNSLKPLRRPPCRCREPPRYEVALGETPDFQVTFLASRRIEENLHLKQDVNFSSLEPAKSELTPVRESAEKHTSSQTAKTGVTRAARSPGATRFVSANHCHGACRRRRLVHTGGALTLRLCFGIGGSVAHSPLQRHRPVTHAE